MGEQYLPTSSVAFAEFTEIAEALVGRGADAAVALAATIGRSAAAPVAAYTGLVDLLLGLDGVLYATEAAAEDEDPVIDPDGCAWIAGGLERFVAGHERYGERVEFATVGAVMRSALSEGRLADQQLRWLEGRLDAMRGPAGEPPTWAFTRTELAVLGRFYRQCAEQGFAVFAQD
ncbi:hypothetical protein [Pilimelia columellifera]|uniref:hypothetical protein n=1 Tax=Pilimelia columellifera TaxID=706574 RepID=UPI003CD078AF